MDFSFLKENFVPILKDFPRIALDYVISLSGMSLVAYACLMLLLIWGFSLFKKYSAMEGGSSLNTRQVSEQAARSQDPLLAGELYEQAQNYQQAIEAYKSVRAFQKLGRVYEHLKQWDDAAQFYNLSGDSEKSAIMYQRGRNYLQAADCYLKCNKNLLAAEMYEKGKEYKKAAIQYEKFGKQLKSAQLYKLSKDYERAAEKFEAYFLKQKVGSSNITSEKKNQIADAAFESGTLYVRTKKFKKAMEIFSAGNFPEQAADAAVHSGDLEKAAQFYLSAKLYNKAAKLFDDMGDQKQGHWVMAKKYQEDGDLLEAAKSFQKGESWSEAAEIYEQLGHKSEAGEMYQQAGDYHRSADLFLLEGNLASAAKSFEKAGRLDEASDLYVKLKEFTPAAQMQELIGNYYSAGLLFQQSGDIDQSISHLQKVDADSEDFCSASLLLGELLIERKMIPSAKDCFQKVTSRQPISAKNIDIYYRLAILHESEESFNEANTLYEQILSTDFNYKDVKQRSSLLKKTLEKEQKALEASASAASKSADTQGAVSPGRYKMIKKIGQGGMGVVYLAEDAVLKREVAYKILPQSIRENATVLKNFLQEARIAAALNHPNIVTIFDTGKNEDEIYITMEYIDGMSLKHYLEKYKSSVRVRVEIMKSVCRGVSYAHERNVIHRDLKPGNIMLLKDRTVKIMDFGLAKVLTDTMKENTSVKGTPLYMPPEQIIGEKVDTLSDIYSLGCTFYRMLTGHPPFSKGDIYYQHLHTPPTPPKMTTPDLPDELNTIVLKCIEKEKNKRFQSVNALLEALSSLTKVLALS